MKIRPLQDRIVVKRLEGESTTKGGIIIPDTAKEKPIEGKVVAVGNGKVLKDGKTRPLEVKVEEEVDGGKYVRRFITYESEPGSRVPAYLCIPKAILKGAAKAPAILCLHGTDNTVGHGTVVGPGKNANRNYASELAERADAETASAAQAS